VCHKRKIRYLRQEEAAVEAVAGAARGAHVAAGRVAAVRQARGS